MPRTSPPARPRLEALEDRWCPAAMAFAEAGTLHIWGTVGRDVARIDQNDHTGFLTVTLNGGRTYYSSAAITALDVQLGAGRDDFIWQLTGGPYRYYKDADINLGDGSNKSIIDFSSGLLAASLDIVVTGGAQTDLTYAHFGRKTNGHLAYTAELAGGDDTASATMDGDLINTYVQFTLNGGDGHDALLSSNSLDRIEGEFNSIDLDIFSTFGVVMNGGTGDDVLAVDYSGVLDGALVLRLDGGANQDELFANLYMQNGSDGSVNARVLGGDGSDDLQFALIEEPSSQIDILEALLDGGTGLNFCDWPRTTSNVTVVNCL